MRTIVSASYRVNWVNGEIQVGRCARGTCSGGGMLRSWVLYATAQLCLASCGNDLGYPRAPDAGSDPGGGDPAERDALPCDVRAFLADHCQGCHGARLAGGAPMSLMTYRDLTARNADGVEIAQRALARIKSAGAPMPPMPAPSATATDISMFEAWVAAGTPTGDCSAPPEPGPFDGPTVCTSSTTWTGGDRESPLMHPGRACIACHAVERSHDDDAPKFRVAGTVFPTGHEPDDCNGAASATVEVTDATGAVTTLPVNAAGNFFTSAALASPIHVAVVANGKRRAMSGSPPTGDCNSCHTQDGANLAPGRIALP